MPPPLTQRMFICGVVACALLVAMLPRAHAQAPQPSLTLNQVDASAYPDLRAVLTVLDANGVPVAGLTAAQFQGSDGDSPVPVAGVQSAQDASVPLSVVIAIDISGSMAGEPLDRAKQAATQFVQNLGPDDRAALITFAATVTIATAFTGDKPSLTNAIAGLQAAGGTALYEAVQASAFALRSASSTRRAIVLLTDGQNDAAGSQATADGALAAALSAAAPVFTVGFGDAPDAAYLQGLSSSTRGQYRPATAADVSSVYGDIAALLRSQYVLTMRSGVPADGAQAALRIVATAAGGSAAGTAPYTRGKPPPVSVATEPAPAPTAAPASGGGSGGSNVALMLLMAIVAAIVVGAGGFGFVSWRNRRRAVRHQLEVVAPNPALAAAQGVPRKEGAASAAVGTHGRGRLIDRSAEGAGATYELGDGPVVIGSSKRNSTILLPAADGVAPEHARIWVRDGHYLLHHTSGARHRTLVGGRPVEWVTLEPGDEIQIGTHRFLFQE